jgi:hypothetical protein
MNIIPASDLARHSRVILNLDDTPHLVDSAKPFRGLGIEGVVVRFSSGEVRTYDTDTPVVTP